MLELSELKKSYPAPGGAPRLVVDVSAFAMKAGEQVALEGASGSGKTTLLHMIAGIVRPTSGRIVLAGGDMTAMSEAERDVYRARHIGYVFQTFNLLQGYTALENVMMGSMFGAGPDRAAARALLETLGLGDRLDDEPSQLSTGQQQRVALARALSNRPDIVLADEPTGNLDAPLARDALKQIRDACRDRNAALLLVSHDRSILDQFDRVVRLAEINRALNGGGRA
jgi:putative ABC transport system ATP-binding protein